jgi:eukaryotic-like serine/threonine-protein kinase
LPLNPGAQFGPYQILALLGAGGMGVVYRARDARLSRDVALKVLAAGTADDPDRVRRFEQEARAAATLNHPNVMAVFDVGVENGTPYIVSELLEGQTLRDRLATGALSARTACALTMQIANGLAAAHDRGIVHRDLKPENVFVTADGRAKILDFGIAKMVAPTGDDTTRESPATGVGRVIGTAGYMAPEQVRGDVVDHRADIFSLGALCYEMLAGHGAFAGDTSAERMAAILKSEPPSLDPAVPLHLDRIARRALEKDPAHRFQSVADIAFALEAIAGTTMSDAPEGARQTSRPGWRRAATGLILAVVGAAAAVAVMLQLSPSSSSVATFDARTFDHQPITAARYMPDGQTIVYSAIPPGRPPELFVINPNAEAPQRLEAPSAHLLAVSTKGELAIITQPKYLAQRIYGGTLSRMTIGSSPRPVAENVREADWSPDGVDMAVVQDIGDGRDRLEYPAGTTLYEASGYLNNVRVSPDGRTVAFVEHRLRFDDRGWVKVVTREGTVTTLTEELFGVFGVAWTDAGRSLVFSGSASAASLLQPMTVPVSGREPARLVVGVPARFIVMDALPDGRWLAVREDLSVGVRAMVPGQDAERDLSWIGTTGATSLSRDGQWMLMVDVGPRGGPNYGVVLRKTDGSTTVRLGEGLPQGLSPDGLWAAAIVSDPGSLMVYPTGPGESKRINIAPIDRPISSQWFPDSQSVLVCGTAASRAPRCYRVYLSGAPAQPLAEAGVRANVAPDGTTLLLALPDGRFQLSTIGGQSGRPVAGVRAGESLLAWSRDSQSIYVQSGIQAPAHVERIVLATGARTVVRELSPSDAGTVTSLYVADWVDDGRWYAYRFTSLPSTLFVVSGTVR